jgi:hypothetical protein
MLRTKGMVVDARGDLTGDERETGESWMSLGQAEALLKDNTPKRKGMAPDLKAMGNTK